MSVSLISDNMLALPEFYLLCRKLLAQSCRLVIGCVNLYYHPISHFSIDGVEIPPCFSSLFISLTSQGGNDSPNACWGRADQNAYF